MSSPRAEISLREMADKKGNLSVICCGICDSNLFYLLANGTVCCASCNTVVFGMTTVSTKVIQ